MNVKKETNSVNVFSAAEIDKLQSAISKANANAKQKSQKNGGANFSFFAYHR